MYKSVRVRAGAMCMGHQSRLWGFFNTFLATFIGKAEDSIGFAVHHTQKLNKNNLPSFAAIRN